jgi:hypothetical protein
MNKLTIAVDFDGTIVDHAYPNLGQPNLGAIEAMLEWQEKGAKLILWTMRSGDELMEALKYTANHGIEFYGVNGNPDQWVWTKSPKALADIYVDDAAFGAPLIHPEGFNRPCIDWSVVRPAITRELGN